MTLLRRLTAEGLGTGILTAAVVGSGIMAEQLAQGNPAIALLANSIATMAALAALIALFAPVSGAHLNPVVSVACALLGRHPWFEATFYVLAQTAGAILGTMLAHAMFGLALLQLSTHMRTGPAIWLSEVVATGGLMMIILGGRRAAHLPWMVASWIGAAYWFTASTSFANPAVAIARSLTDTFAGIRVSDVPALVGAEFVGMLGALGLGKWLFRQVGRPSD